MSVFINSLKSFQSNITGETKEYKINNAVWALLKAKFGLSQTQWAMEYGQEEVLAGVKFIVCVLQANGLEVTEQEVLDNTNVVDVMDFVMSYEKALIDRTESQGEEGSTGKK